MKRILIVDDQPEVRELIDVTLRIENYDIFHADNGEKAVAVAKEKKPDVIIMDVMMPGAVDGVEATRRIKADPATRSCKIIMLTAKSQQVDKDLGYSAGADDYFCKPFSPLDLIRKVEEVLNS